MATNFLTRKDSLNLQLFSTKELRMTGKQEMFAQEYLTDMNATAAAKRAGYSERTAYSQGQRLLKNKKVKAEIQEALKERKSGLIATREQRQELWTRIMFDEEENTKDRLRASELLGKSFGDFVDRLETKGEPQLDVSAQIRMILLEREEEKREEQKQKELAEQ